jgi:hypothetical protein
MKIEQNEKPLENEPEASVLSSKLKINKGLNYNNNIFNGAYGWGGIVKEDMSLCLELNQLNLLIIIMEL